MKHNLRMLVSIVIVAIALGGCASTKQSDMARDHLKAQAQFEKAEAERKAKANEVLKSQISDWPAWATEQPSNGPAGIYAVGMASSSDPSIALRKAKLKAEFELAQSVRQEISGQERQADLDDGFADVRSEYELLVDRFVASVPLRGHQVVEQHLTVSEGKA